MVLIRLEKPKLRRRRRDIGEFVVGDIPRIEHPAGVIETLGGTPGASFAFADNIIGPDERVAIRNVVDAPWNNLQKTRTKRNPPIPPG